MSKLRFLVVLSFTVNLASGQEQFLREVKNPSGPSQIVLRGGFLGNSQTPNEVQVVEDQPEQPESEQQQQQFELSDNQQSLPLQASLDAQPIPQGGSDNPFTNGDSGFGLRLTQPQQAPLRVQQPENVQQQQSPGVSQQQQQPQTGQPAPVIQQTPLTLPPLPPGQQYVDVYGRPIIFTEPQVQNQPQPVAPQPQVTQPAPVQQQAFVDQYGRQLAQIETQQAVVPVAHNVVQNVVQPTGVIQNVVQPAAVVQNIVQPAAVEVPVLHKAPPPLLLHTYAVPTVRKVGNLVIPYAQKITVAKKLEDGVVFPPTVSAPAIVKSKHRTVFSPVKVVAPVAAEVPVINEVHQAPLPVVQHQTAAVHAPAPVIIQEQQHVVVEQPQIAVAHPPQQLVQVAHPPQQLVQVAHPPQQLVEVAHPPPQQLVQVAHPPQQLVQVAHPAQHLVQVTHHQPLAVANPHLEVHHHPVIEQQHHIVQFQVPHVLAAHPAPVVVKKVKQVPVIQKTIVPDYTLIHQPVLPKVLFQKHIFNVKHGSEPLIYQDLCTVYPYQKNLRACVLKKAVLPELHHPDIHTINVEQQSQQVPQTDQTIIAGGSAIVSPVPKVQSQQPQVPTTPTVTVTKRLPANIQDTIKRESQKAATAAKVAVSTTTVQPETAESRDSSSSGNKSRRRRKGSSSKTTSEFKLV